MKKQIAPEIRARRRELKLTQKALAKKVGISEMQLWKYEAGRECRFGTLEKIAKTLGVKIIISFEVDR